MSKLQKYINEETIFESTPIEQHSRDGPFKTLYSNPVKKLRYFIGAKVRTRDGEVVLTSRLYNSLVVLANIHKYHDDNDGVLRLSLYTKDEIEGLGLIGPGVGWLTTALEWLLGWSMIFKRHAIFHDSFGLYYKKFKKTNGYCYGVDNNNIFAWLKGSCFFGHITGLWHFTFNYSKYQNIFPLRGN